MKRVEELKILYTLKRYSPEDGVTPTDYCFAETEGISARYCRDQEVEIGIILHSRILIDKLFEIGKNAKKL